MVVRTLVTGQGNEGFNTGSGPIHVVDSTIAGNDNQGFNTGSVGVAVLVTAALAGALALVGRLPLGVRVAALGVAVFVLAGAALAPFTDESVTERTAAGAVLVLAASAVTWFAPQPWRRSLGGPVGLGLLWMAVAAWFLASEGLQRMLNAGSAAWSGNADDTFTTRFVDSGEAASWLLPVVVVAAVAALVAVARS